LERKIQAKSPTNPRASPDNVDVIQLFAFGPFLS